MLFRKERHPYRVTIHLDGRHPYLHGSELDYETRDVVFTVPARSWNDAAKVAMCASRHLNCWSKRVKSVEWGVGE